VLLYLGIEKGVHIVLFALWGYFLFKDNTFRALTYTLSNAFFIYNVILYWYSLL